MILTTPITIKVFPFEIFPTDRLLFVGSCFADNIGRRFVDNHFNAIVNPFGVMYNPASVMHTVDRLEDTVDVCVITLGTNHIYILKETGEIVDNCKKRPQNLFEERELGIDECEDFLRKTIAILRKRNPEVKVVITVSPIRYAKYGFHESRLSKATLLLAADRVEKSGDATYFPAYEIMNDELRDYRFHAEDMIHPSEQAVKYIYERFAEATFSKEAQAMVSEWAPIRAALNHRPFNPDSEEHKAFVAKVMKQKEEFERRLSATASTSAATTV